MAGRRNRRPYPRCNTRNAIYRSFSPVQTGETKQVPIAISEIANLSATKLIDCALFKFVSGLWLARFDSNETYYDVTLKERIKAVIEYFLEYHPDTPTTLQRQIINAIVKMGREMSDYFSSRRRKFHGLECPEHIELNVPFIRIRWTTQYTVDRVKTSMSYHKEFNKRIEGYECPEWLKIKWCRESWRLKSLLVEYFGKYSTIVYIYWAASIGYRTGSISDYLTLCSTYFQFGTIEEKVLRFFIINGNTECLDYFRNRLTPERHQEIATEMIEDIIRGAIPNAIRVSEHIFARTIVFLWRYLDRQDRCRIVQRNFSEFYHYLLCSPETESLVSAVEWYEPLRHGTRESCRYLECTASKIHTESFECQRYRHLFWSMFKSVRISLSTIDIVNLLELLLAVNDIETASMMVRAMDEDQRNELLDEIHLVWNDLWKATVDRETFFTFFIDVQSHVVRSVMRKN